MSAPAPLALGGAQFGLDYGITNSRGRLLPAEVEGILKRAQTAGVKMIDTAPAYGDSEKVIGDLLGDAPGWRIVTKTADLASAAPGAAGARLSQGLERSLERLRRPSVDTLLFHRVADLGREDAGEILQAASDLKRAGLVRRLGLSIYDAADLDDAVDLYRWDVVQVPLSILDQRLIRSGDVARLAGKGIEVHIRSLFLQGLLLCAPAQRPAFAASYAAALNRVGQRAAELRLSPLELCLSFVRRLPGASICIIGISSVADLDQALDAAVPELPDLSDLAVDDPALVDPRRWPSR